MRVQNQADKRRLSDGITTTSSGMKQPLADGDAAGKIAVPSPVSADSISAPSSGGARVSGSWHVDRADAATRAAPEQLPTVPYAPPRRASMGVLEESSGGILPLPLSG